MPEICIGGPGGGKTRGPSPIFFHRHPALLFGGVFLPSKKSRFTTMIKFEVLGLYLRFYREMGYIIYKGI
jgi:hypothetical protein